MKRNRYIARPSGEESRRYFGTTIDLRLLAETIEQAATHAAHRMFGRRAVAIRCTGTAGMSGVFQAYTPTSDGALNITGPNFHVAKVTP